MLTTGISGWASGRLLQFRLVSGNSGGGGGGGGGVSDIGRCYVYTSLGKYPCSQYHFSKKI